MTNQRWDIFSYNYRRILSTLRDADAVKSKMQLFFLSLRVKLEKKMKHRKKGLEANTSIFFVPQSNSVICWKSKQFPDNWSWHSSLDRVGRRCEFQQISELWIRIVYLHAKCLKRLSVIRKSKEWLRRHQRADMWQSVNRRVYQRISNNDVDVRGETVHSMQQQSEFQRRNLWSLLTHLDTWNIKLFHLSCS